MKILSILFWAAFLVSDARAAQTGTIIVDEATVYEYPQRGSPVISRLEKDQAVAVSNLPTEGFYKARLPNGEIGWISGNDIYVGAIPPTPTLSPSPKSKKKVEKVDDFEGDYSRILLMMGVQYPSYNGFKTHYVTEGITPGYGGVLEFQFALSKRWHWAGRAEFNFAKVDSKEIAPGKTQTLKQSSIPLQLGLNFSPITTRGFRIGLGAYAGVALSSNTTVSQTTTSSSEQVEYASYDPTALGVIQMTFGLGTHIGLIFEGGYRYQKTGQFSSSTRFGGVPAFSIDYSGPVGRLGFEFKF